MYKILFIAVVIIFSSCTPLKKLKYLQDYDSKVSNKDTVTNKIPEYKVRSGDILYLKILGLDEKTFSFFNTQEIGYGGYNNITVYLNSFSVTDSGFINIPVIGQIFIKDNTILEIQKKIQLALDTYITQGTAIVRLANFNISVLGEVNKPGSFTVYDDKITIFQALGLAGDMTVYGNREKVTIIRNTTKGITVNYFNVNKKDIIKSEFYYIYPSDIIYIEPLKTKTYGFATFPIATILTAISTLILTLNYISK
ncbi:MAG: polysaccharide biosynthesis/export family protein [Bacteroidota bacterium]